MTDRQRNILAVTQKIFTEKGYYGTTMNAIAEGVGIRKASLYAHFEDKDAIVHALFEQVLSDHTKHVAHIFDKMANQSTKNQMYIYLRDYVDYCYNNPTVELWNHFYYYPPVSMTEWIRVSTHRQEDMVRDYMMDLIIKSQSEGILRPYDPVIIHQLYYNLCLGFIMSAPEYEKLDMHDLIKESFVLFWDGVKANHL